MGFPVIMKVIWQRLNDHGKGWRHIEKVCVTRSLVLLLLLPEREREREREPHNGAFGHVVSYNGMRLDLGV
jgi:hypothetical protein